MKQTQQHSHQGSTGVAGNSTHAGSSHGGRTGTHHDNNHGYRHTRDTLDAQTFQNASTSHGQRSKSTSHHNHSSHNGREGTSNTIQTQQESLGAQGRNAPQPRSNSHVKGASTSSGAATRDNHAAQTSKSGTSTHASGSRQAQGESSSSNANAVGHYILGKALGEGTFGKVKLGTHVLTGEKVAVKVLEKSKIKDKKDVERISREIKILKQLHHPNVVQIYEIIETDKDLYLVMEFASGGELFELIVQNQKLKERTASKHLQELLAGVHYIHQLGICHRDLKPENLLLDFDGQLKIVDFGLSNLYEKGMTLKTACGSPCYAAPEMIAGNRYHGLKSDIWSCGVVLYAMLCGYLPFEDQKTSNLYKKIMNAEYSLPKFLSSDAKDILSKIFVTDPTKRISIDQLKQHPWYRLYQPETQNYHYHQMPRTVNEKLVMKMEASLGFSTESVQRAVENNKHNHLSATYYLLLKKYAQSSYKNGQAHRNASVPSRIDTSSKVTDNHQQQQIASHAHTSTRRSSTKPTNQNSDSKKGSQPTVDSDPAFSSKAANSGASSSVNNSNNSKNHKFRSKGIEAERLKAPVQDQLVLKNHRREQSANATAGRHNRNGEWGSVEDERRTESYTRPVQGGDDYEIVISKVNKPSGGNDTTENRKEAHRDQHHFNQNMRQHFASPSPDAGPGASRGNRAGSSNHPSKSGTSAPSGGIQKVHVSAEPKAKPMEVNISNIKQQYEQVSTPSQVQSRGQAVNQKQALPKPATYTQATVSSQQRNSDKSKQQTQKPQSVERHQPSHSQSHQASHSNHRKAKSGVPDSLQQQKASSTLNATSTGYQTRERETLNKSQPGSSNHEAKFSQTQKIQSISKSSEQHSRQQQNLKASGGANTTPSNQTAKVADLIDNLNMQSLHKTYFDQIAAKHASTSAGSSTKTSGYVASKQPSFEQTAGIEGNNTSQTDPVVNVNKSTQGGGSSGIFQSLTSVMQRPIIQDMNSQNLLKRLEEGSSENQLRQNFVTRQSIQSTKPRKNEQGANKGDQNATDSSSSRKAGAGGQDRRSTLQVEQQKSQPSRLSQMSQQQQQQQQQQHSQNYPATNSGTGQQVRTPVMWDQTLDTVGEVSCHELKIPVNPDTDRGVSKSIFYGTQRVANLNQEIQRYSNERLTSSKLHSHGQPRNEFSKTQAISPHQSINGGYSRNSIEGAVEQRSSKNVTHRIEQATEQSHSMLSAQQPTKTSQSTKHSRQSKSTVGGSSGAQQQHKRHDDQLNNSRVNMNQHQRQSNNGYSIPMQHGAQGQVVNGQYSTVKTNSQQKFQSLKANSAIKVAQTQQSIDHGTSSSKPSGLSNYSQLLSQTLQTHAPIKKKDQPAQNVLKTRSHSVSTTQKNSQQVYTPSSQRKGSSTANQSTLLATSSAGAAQTLTAHYRCSTASSTNKERRSSQPPQNTQVNQSQAHANASLFASATHQSQAQHKQRSSSSTNYQSAFLGKSLDAGGRNEGGGSNQQFSQQRQRQKSTRDHPANSSLLQQQMPSYDRQFQSITQASQGNPNSSMLTTPLVDDTIFNQSFNGAMGQYQTSLQANTTNTYNKRRQQVASINELLNVAETLRQSSNNYQMRPRVQNPQPNVAHRKEDGSAPAIQVNNYFLGAQQQNNSSIMMQQQQQQPQQKTSQSKPIVVSLNSHAAKQQPATVQNELNKASLMFSQQQQQPQASQARGTSQNMTQQQQSLTTAMKQITDGLLARQHQQMAQPPQPPGGYSTAAQMQQSYLSDMFAKQNMAAGGAGANMPTNQLFKKQTYYNTNGDVHILGKVDKNGTIMSQPDIKGQTQQIGLKSAIYSPNSRGNVPNGGNLNSSTIEVAHDSGSFQNKTPFKGKQSTLDASSTTTPHNLLYNQQQPTGYVQPQGPQYQGVPQMPHGKEINNGHLQQAHYNLLQQHQSTMQQLNTSGYHHQAQTASSGTTPLSNNFMPGLSAYLMSQCNNPHQR